MSVYLHFDSKVRWLKVQPFKPRDLIKLAEALAKQSNPTTEGEGQ